MINGILCTLCYINVIPVDVTVFQQKKNTKSLFGNHRIEFSLGPKLEA